MIRYLWSLPLLLGLALLSCRGCGDRGPESLLELVSPTAAVVHIPDLAKFSRGSDAFVSRITRKSAVLSNSAKERVRNQLGFNPFDPEQWSQAGIAPEGGMVMFTEGTTPVSIVAVQVTDKARFEKALAAFIKHVDGADKVSEERRDGITLKTIGRPFGDQVVPVVYWAHLPGAVLLTQDSGRDSLVAALKRIRAPAPDGPRPSLANDPDYAAAMQKLPAGLLTFRALGESAALMSSTPTDAPIQQIAASLQLSAKGLSSNIFLQVQTQGDGLQGALGNQPALPLTSRVPPDAVIVAATHGAQAQGLQALRTIEPIQNLLNETIARIESGTGVSVEEDALPTFAGPLTLSVHLNDVGSLPQRLQTRNLAVVLDVVHFAVTAALKDPEAMKQALDKSQAALAQRGVPLRKRTVDVGGASAVIYEHDRPDPKLAWGVWKDLYIYAAGSGRIDKTLSFLAHNGSTLPQELAEGPAGSLGKEPGAALVVVRGGKLAEATSQVNLGAAVTALLGAVVELVRTTGDVALSVQPHKEGLKIQVNQVIQ